MICIVRRERLDNAKRARLVEAAIEEFAERGAESASYNKIIERSGLSKGTVYYYFDNKDSLLLMVLDEISERFQNAIGDLKLPETKEAYWETALEYHERAIRFCFQNPHLWRVFFWMSKDSPCNENLDAFNSRVMSFMEDLLTRGQEIGAVRKDFPPGTVQRLMHTIGKVLSADVFGYDKNVPDLTGETEQAKIEQFMLMIHDLSKRILTPKEDFSICFTRS